MTGNLAGLNRMTALVYAGVRLASERKLLIVHCALWWGCGSELGSVLRRWRGLRGAVVCGLGRSGIMAAF